MNVFERVLENPDRLALVKRAGIIALAVIVGLEVLVVHVLHLAHPHFEFELVPAFGSIYGLVSCVLIIVVSKLLGKLWLMRREDYYD